MGWCHVTKENIGKDDPGREIKDKYSRQRKQYAKALREERKHCLSMEDSVITLISCHLRCS